MNEHKDFSAIPSAACVLTVGDFELGDNGEKAKTAPVRLVARSGKPIEHWFWGRVVHDLAGMHLSKPRLPIDYVHDSKEVIGYLNRFDVSSGDLVTTGALVPYKENDRANEIMHKMRAGVPYEASINFGGDGIKVQEIGEGETAEVNGARFDGPGVIVREWPLRGVAICPYGADANTESAALSGNKTYTATVMAIAPAPEIKAEEVVMEAKPVEQKEIKEEVKQMSEEVKPVAVEAKPVEAEGVKPVEAVEAKASEEAPVEVKPVETPKPELSREEFVKIADEFGDSVAVKIVRQGGDYQTAQKIAFDAMKEENKRLQGEVAESKKLSSGQPVKVVAAPADGKKGGLFKTGK